MSHRTKPLKVEGELPAMASWQTVGPTWSFGDSEERLFAPPSVDWRVEGWANGNRDTHNTSGLQRIDVPSRRVVSSPRPVYGQTSLRPLYQWEGVVEELTDDGFRARLVPVEGGVAARGKVEYTEFSLDDLSTREDRERVEPGASFYWTIGKGKNRAGVVANVSLVRFRRPAPVSSYRRNLARREAQGLLEDLGGDEGS